MIDLFLPSRAAVIERQGHPRAGLIAPVHGESTAKVTVTPEVAMTYAAIWAGVRVLSETVATLPCLLYRRAGDRGKERATEDPRFGLVHDAPNDFMTAYSFFEVGTANQVLRGNTYAKIVQQRGEVSALEVRLPQTVRMEADDNGIFYRVDELKEVIDWDDMLHVFGISSDGLQGIPLVMAAQQSMGTAIATERYAGSFFGNGAKPGGTLQVPGKLLPENREALRKEWDNVHRGADKANKIAILHGGMEFTPFTLTNDEAQFIESRKFSVAEVGRWLRIPAHLLNDLERATFSNIEQLAIEFVKYSLMPWLRRWETQLSRKLLARDERNELFFEFMVDALLRGDQKSRYDAFKVGREWGWLSTNDIRGFENMNPIDTGDDDYLVPMNMRRADEPPEQDEAAGQVMREAVVENAAQILRAVGQESEQIRNDLQAGHADLTQRFAQADERVRGELSSVVDRTAALKAELSDRYDSAHRMMVGSLGQIARRAIHDAKRDSRNGERKLAVTEARRAMNREKEENKDASFIAWIEDDYMRLDFLSDRIQSAVETLQVMGKDITTEQVLTDHREQGKQALLFAADGDPNGFVERVEKCL